MEFFLDGKLLTICKYMLYYRFKLKFLFKQNHVFFVFTFGEFMTILYIVTSETTI